MEDVYQNNNQNSHLTVIATCCSSKSSLLQNEPLCRGLSVPYVAITMK